MPHPPTTDERFEWKRLELERLALLMKEYPDHVVYRLSVIRCAEEIRNMRIEREQKAEKLARMRDASPEIRERIARRAREVHTKHIGDLSA